MEQAFDATGKVFGGAYDETEMPKYRCHKDVWALKIMEIRQHVLPEPRNSKLDKALDREEPIEILPNGCIIGSAGALLICDGIELLSPSPPPSDVAIWVSYEYVRKHQPRIGGYYVVYKDGYKSFSPAEAFEEGYTPIDR